MGDSNTSASTPNSIWEEIEHSESYLVSSMYDEAASLSSSVINRLRDNFNVSNQTLYDMMESAGVVFVQSLKELGRASDIMNELRQLFVSVTHVPVQVLLIGACLQISEESYDGVKEFLEEFLRKWSYEDRRHYIVNDAQKKVDSTEGCDGHFVLGIDQYCKVAEMYAVTLLGTVLNDVDLAISWIEKASLPEEKRKDILRRLHSLYSVKATNVSQGSSLLSEDFHEVHSSSLKNPIVSERSSEALNVNYLPSGESGTKQALLKFSRQTYPRFLWFRAITLKFGTVRMVISNWNVAFGCLLVLAYYLFRRKQASIRRTIRRRVLSVKKTLVDLWQLAFSFQVNPLAAVQPLPVATQGGR
ncbi:protein APEM9-like [Mangifera indica]|uniref:protein APEM9-like n=1 Tax=Mangifera indica TaxID=29780 RepID=UPI001CF976B3|nr:protein APEM9-like [Mangifera indica]